MRYRKLAFRLSIVSGILLILSGTTGYATWLRIGDIILEFINIDLLRYLLVIVMLMASLGGLSVILGGYLIKKKFDFVGRMMVLIGSGTGVISLVINILYAAATGEISIGWFLSSATLGILLAVIVQLMTIKKVQKYLRKI